jgi:hypothetical protein
MMLLLLSIRMSRISFIWKTKKMRTLETFSENQEEASAEKKEQLRSTTMDQFARSYRDRLFGTAPTS